jgi:predicted RNA-binding Zn-ribbon protein involved in translation (DUF1610 family)
VSASSRGVVYRCPVCGAEVMVLVRQHGRFDPRCCNTAMRPRLRRVRFFLCPICGAEVASLLPPSATFRPRCCNVSMVPMAA